ncbi:hypothetical protein [Actinomadura hibisca]|uniref:hypothetical protein n=1 Tax=Actinomadura hibisca TaxID=68565 RepID=UPI000830D1B8|nr:hypothetical protein [Actinomadura hibisca]
MSRDYRPALDGVPRYTSWAKVPAYLYTRTQLGHLSPPRKPASGAMPVGQVLYHGNCYAPLYTLAATVPKRAVSPAQRAALERARQLQFECRLCGEAEDEPLGKGRICYRCRTVRQIFRRDHQAAISDAALHLRRLRDRTAVLVAVDDVDAPRRIAMVGRGLALMTAMPPPEHATPEAASEVVLLKLRQVSARLEAWGNPAPLLLCWRSAWDVRQGLLRLLASEPSFPSYGDDPQQQVNDLADGLSWLTTYNSVSLQDLYGVWYGQPMFDDSDLARFHPRRDLPLPGAIGDPIQDVAALGDVLLTVAGNDRPTSPSAPWNTQPQALAGLDEEDR